MRGGDVVDLDQFLQMQSPQGQPSAKASNIVQMLGADRVATVGVMADSSGSMETLVSAVISGLEKCVEAFKGARGSDFYLNIRDFHQQIFAGMLKDIDTSLFRKYVPTYQSTPIVQHSIAMLRDLHRKAGEYRGLGIPTTVAMLILTDGEANNDSYPQDFARIVDPNDFIVGMGIVRHASDDDESYGRYYRTLFGDMGITRVVTPSSDPAQIRHEINQFSRSVASIAS